MDFFTTFWNFLTISAPFLILGLVAAGLLEAFVSAENIKKNLAGKGWRPILKASLVGIPLPLCSCGVIPAATALKKQGASNGAIASFVISTPESGLDSIALTYALMDLPMAIFRPLAAGISAIFAGMAQELFNPAYPANADCATSLSSSRSAFLSPSLGRGLAQRLKRGVRFVAKEILPEIAPWLLVGLVAGAAISYFLPMGILQHFNGLWGKLAMIVVGLPLYICASSSTPIAASLVMKGLSPGTALIFLLVGPATSITNMLVLQKCLGTKGVLINISAVAAVALGASYLVDFIYTQLQWPVNFVMSDSAGTLNTAHAPMGVGVSIFLNLFLLALLAYGLALNFVHNHNKGHQHGESSGCCQ